MTGSFTDIGNGGGSGSGDATSIQGVAVSATAPTDGYVLTYVSANSDWEPKAAASGSFTAPTGTGLMTTTSGAMNAAASTVGTGILTFLATPSSANLASALTDESGTGEAIFSTTPTFKTSVKINNPANTFAYTLTPAALAANRTLNLPLMTGTDTIVLNDFAATLTNKTISGASNTITNVAISTAVSGLGTGVATFLATPSSANLLAALTDETGTGANVFGTSPTIKTSLLINNPADTFAYTITPSAIAANRILNLPLLTATDTLVAEAFTQTLTNKTIVAASNTLTDTSAAIGDILRHDGTRFVRLGRGSANQVLTTNAGATDILWAAPGGGSFTAPTGTGVMTVTSAAMDGASTPVTGTGNIVAQTSPTLMTSLLINNPANTFAYTITPAAIAAARTLTLPLLTAGDTLVAEAFTQTLTNKTISGSSNTITNVAISTAVSGLGTGVATFLATPSSANLAAALTNKSGSGLSIFDTAPLFKTTISLNNPGNTFKYVITPAAIAADRTLTLPLLTGADTLVAEAFTQTLTNKTISGSSNTITNVAISTAVSGLGTGVATFLATPSSANLLAALTDETGTGSAVFGTSPTFKTSLIINNPANTFAYTFTPAAIAAARTITLPLLTAGDTMVCEAFTQTLTNKTLTSPTISGTPTISGSTIVTSVNAKGTCTDRQPVNVQTTDATVTTLDSFTLASGTAVVVSYLVTCIQSTSASNGAWSVTAAFRNNAGTVAQAGSSTTTIIGTSDAAYTCTIDNSTTTIRLRVTGKAATTLQWTAIATALTVIP